MSLTLEAVAAQRDSLVTPLPPAAEADIQKKVAAYDKLLDNHYGLFPHRGTFLLPFTYNATPDQSVYQSIPRGPADQNNLDYNRKVEAEFQISFLVPVYRKIAGSDWDLITAYTHHSWWQLYNARWSRPFRENNYHPELFARNGFEQPKGLGRWRFLNFDLGYMHQSNGQYGAMSRSWDRLFVRTLARFEDLYVSTSLWYRLPENRANDDNPTITKYMGHGELNVYKNFGMHTVGLHTPIAWAYYSLELKYSYPWRDQWRFYTAVRSGYALSMNDYNHETQRIGVGIILENFIDK
jgi:phospholipase A1